MSPFYWDFTNESLPASNENVDGVVARDACYKTLTPLALPISSTSAGRFAKIPTVTTPGI